MADFILKDRDGNDVAYSGINNIRLRTAGGDFQTFVTGDLQQKAVSLDFSEGDMIITPDKDKLFSKVTIAKPFDLVPENIRKDKMIGGVIGTLEGVDENAGGSVILHEEEWLDDICFWDLDGNLVLNIPLSDAANIQQLPDAPTYEGLTFVGWNYTIDQVRTTLYPLDIGPMYVPTDGNTHVKINITHSSFLGMTFSFKQTVEGGVSFNWGDGSAIETVTGTGLVTITHTFPSVGEYELIITVADGCTMTLGSGSYSAGFIKGVSTSPNFYTWTTIELYIGNNVELYDYSLYSMRSLIRLTLPVDITEIPQYACSYLYSLRCAIIPAGVTTIGNVALSYSSGSTDLCRRGSHICLPDSVISLGISSLSNEYFLRRLVIPRQVVALPNGCCNGNNCMVRIFLPDTITEIGAQALRYIKSLKSFNTPSCVTTIGENVFQYCDGIKRIFVPSGVSAIPDYAFSEMYSLEDFVVPASITTIGSNFLYQCTSMKRLIVEGHDITSTGSYLLQYGPSVMEIIFMSPTPLSKKIFYNICTNITYPTIFVHDDAYETYINMDSTIAKWDIRPLSQYKGKLPN